MGGTFSKLLYHYSTRFAMEPSKKLELTKDCHHYQSKGQVPWDIQK